MESHRGEYDWFGCPMQHTIVVEYPVANKIRPYAGSQMGRKEAFEEGLPHIEDDYVYRQEDFVLASLVKQAGYKHGKVEDTFHYHQTMHKPSPWSRKVKRVSIEVEMSREEEVRTRMMQAKGLVKYLEPDQEMAKGVRANIERLVELGVVNGHAFKQWVIETKPAWWQCIQPIKHVAFRRRLRTFLRAVYHLIFG